MNRKESAALYFSVFRVENFMDWQLCLRALRYPFRRHRLVMSRIRATCEFDGCYERATYAWSSWRSFCGFVKTTTKRACLKHAVEIAQSGTTGIAKTIEDPRLCTEAGCTDEAKFFARSRYGVLCERHAADECLAMNQRDHLEESTRKHVPLRIPNG